MPNDVASGLRVQFGAPQDEPPRVYELSREFRFDSAHTLQRPVDAEPSRRIHGHSYRAVVAVRGPLDDHGMVTDLAILDQALRVAQTALDHRLLDGLEGLGPATMENLAHWIWRSVVQACPNLCRVTVKRDSDQSACSLSRDRQS